MLLSQAVGDITWRYGQIGCLRRHIEKLKPEQLLIVGHRAEFFALYPSLHALRSSLFAQLPPEGVEPPPTYVDMDLNHARLPIPPRRRDR